MFDHNHWLRNIFGIQATTMKRNVCPPSYHMLLLPQHGPCTWGGGGGGGLAHIPSGNAWPLCTASAFPILCLTTEVATEPRYNWPFIDRHASQRMSPLLENNLPLLPVHPTPRHPISRFQAVAPGHLRDWSLRIDKGSRPVNNI